MKINLDKNRSLSFLDIVVCGPDMSGTSTQISDIISYFTTKKMKVRDLRGTEIDLLFHAEIFKKYNSSFISLKAFLDSNKFTKTEKNNLILEIYSLISGYKIQGYKREDDLLVGSLKKNKITTYINPNSADVWILEEPTKRGSGQFNRVIEQNRSLFDFEESDFLINDAYSAALAHQTYRIDEFYRIRKVLRNNNKIIVRSRSEESACYQVYDAKYNKSGMKLNNYLILPGHRIAFRYPPTHLFVVCGPENWSKDDYLKFKEIRSLNRRLDDYELNTGYQLMVNKRYASLWLDNLYIKGCTLNKSKYLPKIYRFNISDSKEEIRNKINKLLDKIIFKNK